MNYQKKNLKFQNFFWGYTDTDGNYIKLASNPIQKFTIPKQFTLVDIYKHNPCQDEYSALLEECFEYFKSFPIFSTIINIKSSKVLMRNLDWLESEGFIKVKSEEWVNVYLSTNNTVYKGFEIFDSYAKAFTNRNMHTTHIATIKLN